MPAGKPAHPGMPRAQGILWGAGVLQRQPWQAGWSCGWLTHLRLSAGALIFYTAGETPAFPGAGALIFTRQARRLRSQLRLILRNPQYLTQAGGAVEH